MFNFDFQTFAQAAGQFLDGLGIIAILFGVIFSTAAIGVTALRHKSLHHTYKTYRQNLARSILIGLEFLVAGDIIRSVAGDLNFDSVVILAIIVLVRSFLGVEFEMEIEGRWPWQRGKKSPKSETS
jgi:uncharacterized membrane protein